MPVARALALLVPLLMIVDAAHAVQRTFVSTSGLDTNGCSLVAPCRGFAHALTQTDPGGEIVVLDSGGYGIVSINKNVTIVAPTGVYAGISVPAGQDGIVVTAPATRVVLRGLSINGVGGDNAIRVQAGEIHIENVVVSNMAQAGIRIEGASTVRFASSIARSNVDGLRVVPGAGSASVVVRDSELANNANAGIGVSPNAGGASAVVTIERASVTKNGAGVVSSPGGSASTTVVVTQSVASENAGAGVSSNGSTSTVFVRESAVTRNGTGLAQGNSGVLNACGGNLLVANATPQSGAINTGSCLDVAAGSVSNVATGAGLTGGPITTTGTISLDPASSALTSNYFRQGGNALGATAQLGTTDAQAVEVLTAGVRGLRIARVSHAPYANTISVVSGAPENTTGVAALATVAGGGCFTEMNCTASSINSATADGATVGGGQGNTASGDHSSIAGGFFNVAAGFASTIPGGFGNQAPAEGSTVGGGEQNTATGGDSVVAGGVSNLATGASATIGGGDANTAGGDFSTVAGGRLNVANGLFAAILGGDGNVAGGDYSVAMGRAANAGAAGCFVFSDSVSNNATSCSANTFVARATGGVTFITSGTSQANYNGLFVPAGQGAWVVFSDRDYKDNLTPVDGRDVLRRVASLPIATWTWKTQQTPGRHMGPTAQDFYAAFGLGDTDKGISTVDPDGVALAAIQGLYAELRDRDATIAAQQRDLDRMRSEVVELQRRDSERGRDVVTLREQLDRVLSRELAQVETSP